MSAFFKARSGTRVLPCPAYNSCNSFEFVLFNKYYLLIRIVAPIKKRLSAASAVRGLTGYSPFDKTLCNHRLHSEYFNMQVTLTPYVIMDWTSALVFVRMSEISVYTLC